MVLRDTQAFSLREIATRGMFILLVLGGSFWLLAGQTKGLNIAEIATAISNIPLAALTISLVASALSLWAVAAYDRQGFRLIGLRRPDSTLRSGFIATATSQTLGFGLVIGSLVRWRCYLADGLSLPQAAALTGLISLGFMGCLAWMLGLSTLVVSPAVPGLDIPVILVIVASLALVSLSALQPSISIASRKVSLPTLPILSRFMGLTALDTAAAAFALWILLPAEVRPEFGLFFQVFLICLGLGLMSSTPGGVGIFEVTCLMILSDVPQADLLSAILVFRAIYYGVPFLLAAAMLLEVERTRCTEVSRPSPLKSQVSNRLLSNSSQAEAALAHLGDKIFLATPDQVSALMLGRSGSSLVALGAPLGSLSKAPELLRSLQVRASAEGLAPVLYRAPAGMRAIAELGGWHARKCGEEAVLNPQSYAPSGKKFRELTRKLKQARAAGVEIDVHAPGTAPLVELSAVAEEWKTRHDGIELGFSQGRFLPDYVAAHEVVTARVEGKMIAFITLWRSGKGCEISLDLMRSRDELPQGAMHLLVHEAILWSAGQGATRFSLCTVQLKGLEEEGSLAARIGSWVFKSRNESHGLQGLARFKNAFRPDWEPRYIVTRSRFSNPLALWDLHRLVRA